MGPNIDEQPTPSEDVSWQTFGPENVKGGMGHNTRQQARHLVDAVTSAAASAIGEAAGGNPATRPQNRTGAGRELADRLADRLAALADRAESSDQTGTLRLHRQAVLAALLAGLLGDGPGETGDAEGFSDADAAGAVLAFAARQTAEALWPADPDEAEALAEAIGRSG